MALTGKNKTKAGEGQLAVPRHIAIIMDGNGRWAKKRALPRSAGHSAGAETFRKIARYCRDLGVEYLTVYAFSTENWKRSEDEVNVIMALLEKYLYEAIESMAQEHTRLCVMGDITRLSPGLRRLSERALEVARTVEGMQVNVCFNYGGRDEIIRAAKKYAEDYAAGKVTDIDEDMFSGYLYSAGMPDPDLIIRPSGEIRISNFMLWQSAYAEFYFTDTLWPDFNEKEIDKAIKSYNARDRRYGGAKP